MLLRHLRESRVDAVSGHLRLAPLKARPQRRRLKRPSVQERVDLAEIDVERFAQDLREVEFKCALALHLRGGELDVRPAGRECKVTANGHRGKVGDADRA